MIKNIYLNTTFTLLVLTIYDTFKIYIKDFYFTLKRTAKEQFLKLFIIL